MSERGHEDAALRTRGRAARAAITHALVAAAAGLVALPFDGRLVAGPCVALALALPAAAIGWTVARGVRASHEPAAAAGLLAGPAVLAQGLHLRGLEVGGLDGAYAELTQLVATASAWETPVRVAAVAGLGAGLGVVGAIVADARAARTGPLSTFMTALVQSFALGVMCLIGGVGLGVCAAIILQQVAPLAVVVVCPFACAAAAGAVLVLGGALAPAWATILALAERIDRRLAGPDES